MKLLFSNESGIQDWRKTASTESVTEPDPTKT